MQNEKKKKAIEKKIVAVADDILEEGTRTTTFSALFLFFDLFAVVFMGL